MDLDDTGTSAMHLIRDRDAKSPVPFDQSCTTPASRPCSPASGYHVNAIIERWVQTCRHELLNRTLIWNEHHLRHALRQFELHHNTHRPHQAMNQAAPLRAIPEPITDPEQFTRLDIRRRDQLG